MTVFTRSLLQKQKRESLRMEVMLSSRGEGGIRITSCKNREKYKIVFNIYVYV